MKRLCAALAIAALAALLTPASSPGFGLTGIEAKIVDQHGEPSIQAGSHPFAVENVFDVETEHSPEAGEIPAGQLREVSGELPTGLTGSPYAVPQCEAVDFVEIVEIEGIEVPDCANSSVLGLVRVEATTNDGEPAKIETPIYNLVPPPGKAARLGFLPLTGSPVTIDVGVMDTPPYKVTFASTNVTQTARILSTKVTLWGNPSDPSHDEERGICGLFLFRGGTIARYEGPPCEVPDLKRPFLTLPRSCEGPLPFSFDALSWTGDTFHAETSTEQGMGGCDKLGFAPTISSEPTSTQAESPTGLDFHLDVPEEGLQDPEGAAPSDIKKAVVTLPEGMTVNPSQAEGLGVCSEAQFEAQRAGTEFGSGCPAASKIGTTEVETPLLEGKILKGSLFVAKPYQNPFGALIALYMTFTEPRLGIGIRLAGKVEPDPTSGRLIATFGDPGHELPQQPFSHFRLHFREGGRSPLITPPSCATYTTDATFTPWANPAHPLSTSASFEIDSGVGGGPCPSGAQPFEPGFEAGTLSNQAGSYSPFLMRITRRDGDQDLTKLSAKLPVGLLARLAGVERCPDAQIAAAKAKSGEAELASPSCPLGSQIGTLAAGAGVGSELTYVKGRIYLAGPYNGAPLSVVEIVPAVAGPFDVGDVVVRQALAIDPRTGQARIDGERSDPIPHILAGIPLRVRDIHAPCDRSEFTLNPTSCEPAAIAASLWGGGADPFSSLDDSPVSRQARFQAAGCRALAFGPHLSLRLKGGTGRGAHPSLRAVLRPRNGDANIEKILTRLPRSAFLDQGHIRTICTRVQYAAGGGNGERCPKGSVYGHVTAYTPLLDEPLSGPVFLRSSSHNLPDLVLSLHGLVDFEAVGRIDSKHGGIRTIFTQVPDAPVSRVVLRLQGGKKGLVVNSTNLCSRAHRAAVKATAHNAKVKSLKVAVKPSCQKRKRHSGQRRRSAPQARRSAPGCRRRINTETLER